MFVTNSREKSIVTLWMHHSMIRWFYKYRLCYRWTTYLM